MTIPWYTFGEKNKILIAIITPTFNNNNYGSDSYTTTFVKRVPLAEESDCYAIQPCTFLIRAVTTVPLISVQCDFSV